MRMRRVWLEATYANCFVKVLKLIQAMWANCSGENFTLEGNACSTYPSTVYVGTLP